MSKLEIKNKNSECDIFKGQPTSFTSNIKPILSKFN